MNIVSKLLIISLAIPCCSTLVLKQTPIEDIISNSELTTVIKNPQSEPGGL